MFAVPLYKYVRPYFQPMGNVPYYLSMPHAHTWYVYERDEHHRYKDAPVGIWNNISQQEAFHNYVQLLDAFRESSARVIYLYKGMHRKARASKDQGRLIVQSEDLKDIITLITDYQRLDIDKIVC